jgi:hypothetical protein
MVRNPEWIVHRGQSVLLMDCTDAEEAEVLAALDKVERELLAMDKEKKALLLLNMSNVRPSVALTTRGNELVKACKEAGVPDLPTALVGPEGWQKTVTKTYAWFRRDDSLYVADSVEDAKEWLATHAGSGE